MTDLIGQSVEVLDTPQLLIDLDVVDGNLQRMMAACEERQVALRVHFKSLKCGGLARYIAAAGCRSFLSAKLNEAEVLADAGLTDILIANQIVGPAKMDRLARLAQRSRLRVCVDNPDNVRQLSRAMQACKPDRQAPTPTLGVLGVLVEVDIGMGRCGVPPGEPALDLARMIQDSPGLRFDGLQGYDGHLQLLPDPTERRAQCLKSLAELVGTRRLIEKAGIPVEVVTGAGTGTWEFVAGFEGVSEIQPGSFILMDCAYHAVRPEFHCSLSVLTTVISKRPGWYVLDAGSKAISKDFGMPAIKKHPDEQVVRLSEEHTKVESAPHPTLSPKGKGSEVGIQVGDRREVLPAHCCATMNLHRACIAVRKGKVEALWPIEASGRYD